MNKLFLTLILLVCFMYTLPFFHPGYFSTHDGGWAVVRLTEMVRELKDFQFPPRWSDYLNHGYGYPLFQFAYPFPFYLGTFIKLIGFTYTDSIKMLFVLSVFLSGIGMYLLGKKLTNASGGLIASVFYIIAPYRLSNLYIRGSLGESLSLALYPFLFYFSVRLFDAPTPKNQILVGIFFAVLILTHNISAILVLPFWIGYLMVLVKSKKRNMVQAVKTILPSFLFGFGISSYFFIPALAEKKYILLSQTPLTNISQNFLQFKDYFFANGRSGNPVFLIGLFQCVAVIVSFIVCFRYQDKKLKTLGWFLIIGIVACLFFASSSSLLFWQFPPLKWIDFPWRISNVLIFLMSLSTLFLGGKKTIWWIGIGIVAAAFIFNLRYSQVNSFETKEDDYYLTNDATTTSSDEFMPIWVSEKPKNRYRSKVELIEGDAQTNSLKFTSKKLEFDTVVYANTKFQVNTVYFPGWNFSANGRKIDMTYQNVQGLMTFRLPPGEYHVIGTFDETPIRLSSDIISLVTLVVLPIYYLGGVNKKNKKI